MRDKKFPVSSGNRADYRARTLADTASAVGSMLLFVLFAVCMLLAVAVAADTYSRIKSGFQQSFGAVSSMKYISNKLRSADNVTVFDDGTAAAVENGEIVSVIYFGDGGLYEKTTVSGEEITADGGDRISDIDFMSISERDGLYEITVGSGGESSSVLVRRG